MGLSIKRYRQFELDLISWIGKHPLPVLATLIAVAALFAWYNRFLQDDAYISFIYARNLADGHGLVWTTGERVMGYTDFLWVMILTAGIKLGFAPEGFSLAVGVACFAGTMAVCYRLSRILLDPSPAAWLPIVLLAVNHSFSSYATGGMETQLQTALALLAMLLAAVAYRRGRVNWEIVVAYPVVSATAILTRYNSALLLLPSALLLLYVLYRQEGALSGKATKIATAAIAGVVLLLPVFVWFETSIRRNTSQYFLRQGCVW